MVLRLVLKLPVTLYTCTTNWNNLSIYWFICLLLSLMKLLGSKTLETNVLEFQYVLYWQTIIKTKSLGLGLLKV